jgi:hypothetical protein
LSQTDCILLHEVLEDKPHRLGGIPIPEYHRLSDAAIDDQGMAVVHWHMAPLVGSLSEEQCCSRWIGIMVANSYGGQPPFLLVFE